MKRLITLFLILAASLTLAFAQQTGGTDAAQMDQMEMSEQTLQELRDLYNQLGTLIAELEAQMGMTGGEGLAERQVSEGEELEERREALATDETGGAMTGGMTGGATGGATGGEGLAERQVSEGEELEERREALDETGGAMTGGDMTGGDMTGGATGGMGEAPTLENTISALEGGVENLPLEAAVSNIEGWQAALSEAGYNDVADELGALAAALQADPVDTEEVNSLLLGLGAQTTAAADNATDEETSSQLARLGSFLTELGSGAGTTGESN